MENLSLFQHVLMAITDRELAVVGIVIAVAIGYYHLNEIKKVLGNTKIQVDKLVGLEKSTSTHFILEFPKFIPDIVDLIKSADERLVIFCDIPAYGCFSDPHRWKQYCHAIEDKVYEKEERGKVFTIELICLEHTSRMESYDEVLNDWPKWRAKHSQKLKQFLRERKHLWIEIEAFSEDRLTQQLETLEKEPFKLLLEGANKEMLDGTFPNIKIYHEIQGRMPAFFWLADDRNAVFSIPAYRDEHTELGFSTHDENLIRALQLIRNRYMPPTKANGNPGATLSTAVGTKEQPAKAAF